ncbi:hypothetical protein Tco_1413850, partial [Tanacetum coccineum]
MTPLPPHDQRHLWLHYQVEGYTKEIVHDFEQRLETIFERQVNQVHTLDFDGLTPDMRQDLAERLRMELILEFFSTYKISSEIGLDVANTLCFQLGGARRSMTWRQFILALGLRKKYRLNLKNDMPPRDNLTALLSSVNLLAAKRQKTSEHRTFMFGESSPGQEFKSEPGLSTSGNQEQFKDFDFWTDSYATDDDQIPNEKVSQ